MDTQGPILYQNADNTVILIDIPSSIAAAQVPSDSPSEDVLLSSEPLAKPYVVPKPKSSSAESNLIGNTVHTKLHSSYKTAIDDALNVIRRDHDGPWCLPRKIAEWARPKKRSAADAFGADQSRPEPSIDKQHPEINNDNEVPDALFQSLSAAGKGLFSPSDLYTMIITSPASKAEDDTHASKTIEEPWDPSFYNALDYPVTMSISKAFQTSVSDTRRYVFKIPPRSAFTLGECGQLDSLRKSIEESNCPTHFDFIVLDPPWPNRSVRRKSAYETQATLKDIKELLLGLDLGAHIGPYGLVAVWITNKPAVRSLVLGAGGLFERWNVSLTEEWIWLKTTMNGEPMLALDNIYRKPYELLLVGRAHADPLRAATSAPDVKKRVLVAVPDLHSRKPCLKELIEPLMPDPKSYNALEVFARHLVTGWWSWGNQVLKFNWESYWVKGESAQQPTSAADYEKQDRI